MKLYNKEENKYSLISIPVKIRYVIYNAQRMITRVAPEDFLS
jgi:hypothetical protein